MDDINKKILNLLQQNHRYTYKKIGKRLNMAASSIHNRVKNMEIKGIIKYFGPIIDPIKSGYLTIAWLGLTVDPMKMKSIANHIATYDEVQTVAITTGDHDILAQVIAKNDKTLWSFINTKIKPIDGVKSRMDISNFIDIYKMTLDIKFKPEE